MSDWIDEWEEEGIRPMMGKCPDCGRSFIFDEGILCDCADTLIEEEEECQERL